MVNGNYAAAVQFGLVYESVALQELSNYLGKPIYQCGLYVFLEYPWLGATPDGMIDQDTCVEVKCCYKCRDRDKVPDYLVDTPLQLDKKHAYYHQVQGEILCTHKTRCYFAAYTRKKLYVMLVHLEVSFCKAMVSKLTLFYLNVMLRQVKGSGKSFVNYYTNEKHEDGDPTSSS